MALLAPAFSQNLGLAGPVRPYNTAAFNSQRLPIFPRPISIVFLPLLVVKNCGTEALIPAQEQANRPRELRMRLMSRSFLHLKIHHWGRLYSFRKDRK